MKKRNIFKMGAFLALGTLSLTSCGKAEESKPTTPPSSDVETPGDSNMGEITNPDVETPNVEIKNDKFEVGTILTYAEAEEQLFNTPLFTQKFCYIEMNENIAILDNNVLYQIGEEEFIAIEGKQAIWSENKVTVTEDEEISLPEFNYFYVQSIVKSSSEISPVDWVFTKTAVNKWTISTDNQPDLIVLKENDITANFSKNSRKIVIEMKGKNSNEYKELLKTVNDSEIFKELKAALNI